MKNNENVEIKELPNTPLVYLRHIGAYQGDAELFGRLFFMINLAAQIKFV